MRKEKIEKGGRDTYKEDTIDQMGIAPKSSRWECLEESGEGLSNDRFGGKKRVNRVQCLRKGEGGNAISCDAKVQESIMEGGRDFFWGRKGIVGRVDHCVTGFGCSIGTPGAPRGTMEVGKGPKKGYRAKFRGDSGERIM